jgi:hypothetical protein
MARDSVRRGTLAIALAAAALGVAAPVASAAPPGPPSGILDHFHCYRATQPTTAPPIPPSVQLHDQFDKPGTFQTVRVGKPTQLCNPVTKIVPKVGTFDVRHKSLHLVCFAITQAKPDPTFTVLVDNQFNPPAGGVRKVQTGGRPVQLCLPSWKALRPPPTGEALALLDHFKCYRARDLTDPAAGGVPPVVGLLDQFTRTAKRAKVGALVMLCNPVTKMIPGAVFPPKNPDFHLVCWAVRDGIKAPLVWTSNQFNPTGKFRQLRLGPPSTVRTLCVPSFKRIVT